jgi:hypothetical protein
MRRSRKTGWIGNDMAYKGREHGVLQGCNMDVEQDWQDCFLFSTAIKITTGAVQPCRLQQPDRLTFQQRVGLLASYELHVHWDESIGCGPMNLVANRNLTVSFVLIGNS